jgi:hypothetical protein
MKAGDYQERRLEVAGWPVNLASYRFGAEWRCMADNVVPGAALARAKGRTREEAEEAAIVRAEQLLARTKSHTA